MVSRLAIPIFSKIFVNTVQYNSLDRRNRKVRVVVRINEVYYIHSNGGIDCTKY